jgi:predicted Zn finger-like uncharacterized protein
MKIICDSCGAKYSIADEKVAGKVFKIRCKKCSNMIVVKSDQAQAAAPAQLNTPSIQPTAMAAPAFQQAAVAQTSVTQSDPNGEPIWHVVVGGDQQGPFAPSQIGEMLTVGTIDWEAYVWREGFDGWVPARDVPELVEAVTGQPYDSSYSSSAGDAPAGGGFDDGPTADPEGTAVAASPFTGDFGGGFGGGEGFGGEDPSDSGAALDALSGLGGGGAPASSFGSGSAPFGGAAAAPARTSSTDLFGGSPGAAQASPFGGAAPTSMPDQSAMTGQRNENSVLFSLANLQALATESASSSMRPSKPGHATGEGSGLIDIRALASATGMGAGGASLQPQAKAKEDRLDDLMSIGTGSPMTIGNLGTPVLAPVREESNKKLFIIGGAIAAALFLVLGGTVVYLLTREPTQVAATPAQITAAPGGGPSVPVPAPAAPGAAAQPAGAATGAAQPTPSEPVAANTADTQGSSNDGPATKRPRPVNRGGGGGGGGGSTTVASGSASAANEPAPSKVTRPSSGSIDDLLEGAIGGGGSDKPAAKKEAASGRQRRRPPGHARPRRGGSPRSARLPAT